MQGLPILLILGSIPVMSIGLALMSFSQMDVLVLAVSVMMLFSLFTQMSEGATFGLVSFMNRKVLGAVATGFLLKMEAVSNQQGLFFLGRAVESARHGLFRGAEIDD